MEHTSLWYTLLAFRSRKLARRLSCASSWLFLS